MFIQLTNINKRFGDFVALKDINLEIKKNEFFVLLGPSGCGKTTLMRIISGFEVPEEGTLHINNKDYTYATPQERPTNMVFQSYAIFQNMSVFENVAYGLRILKKPKDEITQKVEKMLRLTDMWGKKDVMPSNLSGGQRQRVALSRALIMEPDVLLLDEPLSALDAKLRNSMRVELISLQERLQITFIMVTHDQSEALAIADRIAVMKKGEVEQVGEPTEIYANPRSVYVADFIGEMNWFDVTEVAVGSSIDCNVAGIGKCRFSEYPKENFNPQQLVKIGVRPENLNVVLDENVTSDPALILFSAEVKQIIYYGNYQKLILTLPENNNMISVLVKTEFDLAKGSIVKIRIPKNKVLFFDH